MLSQVPVPDCTTQFERQLPHGRLVLECQHDMGVCQQQLCVEIPALDLLYPETSPLFSCQFQERIMFGSAQARRRATLVMRRIAALKGVRARVVAGQQRHQSNCQLATLRRAACLIQVLAVDSVERRVVLSHLLCP